MEEKGTYSEGAGNAGPACFIVDGGIRRLTETGKGFVI